MAWLIARRSIIGSRLFALGVEGDDEAILAIDQHGRVFSMDQGGEWFPR
nr:SUKH-3 domain-containing protein [Actinoplanes deccanensis]